MRVAKSGSEEGVSVNAKSRASQNLRFENKSARSGTKRERERGKKGALKARTCPTSSKLAHMLLTAAILTAEFWFG
jgi:hypothetical protein